MTGTVTLDSDATQVNVRNAIGAAAAGTSGITQNAADDRYLSFVANRPLATDAERLRLRNNARTVLGIDVQQGQSGTPETGVDRIILGSGLSINGMKSDPDAAGEVAITIDGEPRHVYYYPPWITIHR